MVSDLENKLDESKKILEVILENTPDIIMIVDHNGIILFINRNISNLSKKEIIGYNSLDLMDVKFHDIYIKSLKNVFQIGKREYFEYSSIDGLSWLARIIPIKENNSIKKAIMISTNLTKRKKTEKELIQEKTFLDSALNSMVDTFFVFDPVNNKAIRWNKSFEEVTGFNSREITSLTSMLRIFNENDLKMMYNDVKKVLKEGKTTSELNLMTKNGQIIPFEFYSSLIKDIENESNFIISIGRNLTERKRIEEITNILAAIVESTGDAIISKDLDGYITFWNKGAQILYGYDKSEVIGKHINIIVPVNKHEEIKTFLKQIKNGKQIQHLETIRLNKKQEKINVSLKISPIIDKNGEIIGASSIARDISERIKADNKFKGLVSTITHELRTPITVISTSYNILKNQHYNLEYEHKKRLDQNIKKNINLLKQLSHEFLTILQLDTHNYKINWKEYNLSKILKNIIYLHKKSIKNKEGLFTLDIDDEIKLHGDPQRIEQVFHIIIDNAIKYSKKNVILKINANNNYKGKYNPKNDKGILLIFKDFGIGISKEDLPYIFDRFFRSKDVINISGSGLGLSIAKQFIKQHKGDIFVESEIDKGTTIFVFLPYNINKI